MCDLDPQCTISTDVLCTENKTRELLRYMASGIHVVFEISFVKWRPNPFPNKQQYKSFENNLGNREIAHHEQFLLFPQHFLSFLSFPPTSSNSKLLSANSSTMEEAKIGCLRKGGYILKEYQSMSNCTVCSFVILTLSQKALVFMCLQYRSLKNTVGKGEIAHNE